MSQDRKLSTAEAAVEFGIPVNTLIKARINGDGPKFQKFGNSSNSPIRYNRSDVEKWVKEKTFVSVAESMGRNQP
jgi:hypothetical protein